MENYGGFKKLIRTEIEPLNIRSGSFSTVIHKQGQIAARKWIYCRDLLHQKRTNIRWLLFCGEPIEGNQFADYIGYIEEKLKVPNLSIIGTTQYKKIHWLDISNWWRECPMRMSFFTILLRTTLNIKEDIQETIFSHPYFKATELATYRFLDGYTKYCGKRTGWYRQFYYGNGNWYKPVPLKSKEIEKLLIKP